MSNATNLPPGFRFHPTDEELIIHYLKEKVSSPTPINPFVSIIADIDLYKLNPWELPGKALFGDGEWFFFTTRDRKYPNGARPNRVAGLGYWKATGTDKPILARGNLQCLGVKKGLVFYEGHSPKGVKTDWIMHEYRLLEDNCPLPKFNGSMRLDDFVLCRIRQKTSTPTERGNNHYHNSSRSSFPRHTFHSQDDEEMKMSRQAHSWTAHESNESSEIYVKSSCSNAGMCNKCGHIPLKRRLPSLENNITYAPNKRLATSTDNMGNWDPM